MWTTADLCCVGFFLKLFFMTIIYGSALTVFAVFMCVSRFVPLQPLRSSEGVQLCWKWKWKTTLCDFHCDIYGKKWLWRFFRLETTSWIAITLCNKVHIWKELIFLFADVTYSSVFCLGLDCILTSLNRLHFVTFRIVYRSVYLSRSCSFTEIIHSIWTFFNTHV